MICCLNSLSQHQPAHLSGGEAEVTALGGHRGDRMLSAALDHLPAPENSKKWHRGAVWVIFGVLSIHVSPGSIEPSVLIVHSLTAFLFLVGFWHSWCSPDCITAHPSPAEEQLVLMGSFLHSRDEARALGICLCTSCCLCLLIEGQPRCPHLQSLGWHSSAMPGGL